MEESPYQERLINCLCGATFLGNENNFNMHLELECPVYALAIEILDKKKENSKN